ncbi:hypothetical protein JTE90_002295 [Oedothorax gibbosus]|uniref:Secreted protein n=1 Tax=Oedothorax gibbosus TaxID=931172 RepID=A0AAV6UJQ7_9ARAC|nr:hypothetical protein JTE90_002295 [Oedothorax gibbosus]
MFLVKCLLLVVQATTSEEWTLVTSKRHPRLAVKCNSKLHVACTIRQSCPSSGSLKSQVNFSKKPVGFAEQPTKLKNWNCGRKLLLNDVQNWPLDPILNSK